MDLRLVECFVEVARRGGFSAAARRLGVTPAAVSQNLRSLEDRLGVRLLERTTRQVRLTAEGARFLEQVAPALEQLAEAAASVGEARDAVRGRLRVSATTVFGRRDLLPLLPAFLAAHPDLTVDLQLSDAFVDLVADGWDLGLRVGHLPENRYIARLLLPMTPLVCAAPAYAARHGLPRTIADIHRHQLIGQRATSSQRLLPWEFQQPDGLVMRVEIAPRLVVDDPEGVAIAAVHGLGLAQLASSLVLPHVGRGELVLALADTAVRTRGLYAVWPSRRHVPRKVSALVEHLAAHFAGRRDLLFEPQPGA